MSNLSIKCCLSLLVLSCFLASTNVCAGEHMPMPWAVHYVDFADMITAAQTDSEIAVFQFISQRTTVVRPGGEREGMILTRVIHSGLRGKDDTFHIQGSIKDIKKVVGQPPLKEGGIQRDVLIDRGGTSKFQNTSARDGIPSLAVAWPSEGAPLFVWIGEVGASDWLDGRIFGPFPTNATDEIVGLLEASVQERARAAQSAKSEEYLASPDMLSVYRGLVALSSNDSFGVKPFLVAGEDKPAKLCEWLIEDAFLTAYRLRWSDAAVSSGIADYISDSPSGEVLSVLNAVMQCGKWHSSTVLRSEGVVDALKSALSNAANGSDEDLLHACNDLLGLSQRP